MNDRSMENNVPSSHALTDVLISTVNLQVLLLPPPPSVFLSFASRLVVKAVRALRGGGGGDVTYGHRIPGYF